MMIKWIMVMAGLLWAFASNATPNLTIYDDGLSCPNLCDAHVVFHRSMNGTKYAHHPDSTPSNPRPCRRDGDCRVCFDDTAQQCLVTPYRGSGPSKMTFDFTPAFYSQWCDKPDIPARLQTQCNALAKQSQSLESRVNCIANPNHKRCQVLMHKAMKEKATDRVKYQQCLEQTEAVFNASRPDTEKRLYECAYSYLSTGGPNSKGVVWKKLQAGACRENTYVGRDGLDCCSGNVFVDATLGIECRVFYPKP